VSNVLKEQKKQQVIALGLTCPRFLYQSKLEFPWVDHTPFVALRTLPPSPSSQML
jgi:hypothetical protein